MPSKIFCIGFHKTGTRSLTTYLDRLGFKSVHWVREVDGTNYEIQIVPHLDDMERVVDALEPVIESYDAFTDVPFPALYPELDRRYPGSKFILVTRDMDAWWTSFANHKNLPERKVGPLFPYEYIQYNKYSINKIKYVTINDKNIFVETHRKHVKCVKEYFTGREEDFLLVDIDDQEIGAKIGAFLGRTNDEPFPHQGKHGQGPWQPPPPRSRWNRFRRWYRMLIWRTRIRLGNAEPNQMSKNDDRKAS